MNKKFEEFINEIKGRLLAYEMDESCFADYDDNDRQMMRRLGEALYPSKQQIYQTTEEEKREEEIISRQVEEQSECEECLQCVKEEEIKALQFRYRQLSGVIENQDIRVDKWLNHMQKQINNLRATKKFDPYKIQPSGYSYATANEKSADEMFEELGYEKREPKILAECRYHLKNSESDIIIRFINRTFEYIKQSGLITEAEDKAIHKKIAELRLLKGNHIVGDIVDGKVLCDDGIWRDYR